MMNRIRLSQYRKPTFKKLNIEVQDNIKTLVVAGHASQSLRRHEMERVSNLMFDD
jgi:hypothetical protein